MRETVEVDLGDRSYTIHIGTGLLADSGAFVAPILQRKRVAVITDENVAALHLDALTAGMAAEGIDVSALILPAGEATKSWKYIQETVEWLLAERVERDDVVIAFGGGVIGMLDTLTARDFLAGYGEVVKYGLLGDAEFFDWLEANAPDMAEGDVAKRIYAVKRSCQMKADIVARDEKERGDRALLNLGHTFCHALEAATGFSDRLLHGEGVAIGCALAYETSMRLGLCSQEAPSRVRQHLKAMGMKVDLADIEGDLPDADALIDLMGQDKKVVDGQIAFIMARSIGDAFVTRDVDLDVVKGVLDDALAS